MKQGHLLLLLNYGFLLVLVSSVLFYYFEYESNKNINKFTDSLWWTIVTFTTVGYGDIIPVTFYGRIIAIISMFLGIGFIGTTMATMTSIIIESRKKELKGMKLFKFKNHLILCGYHPQKISRFLKEFRANKNYISAHIILVSNLIDENPLPKEYRFHFVKGEIYNEQTLIKAGIKQAKWLVVLTESEQVISDEKTILTVMLAEQLQSKIYSIAEIISPQKKELLSRTNCNLMITTSEISVNLIVQALQDPGTIQIVNELINNTYQHKFHKNLIPKEYENHSFLDLSINCLNQENIVIAIERNGKCIINPNKNTIIKENDHYFYISNTRS